MSEVLNVMKREIISAGLGVTVCLFVLWPMFLSFRSPVSQPLRIKKGRYLAGCIPMKDGKLFLINTRRNNKFVFPKGGIEKGENGYYAAGKEAIEEAGVIGKIDKEPLFTENGVVWYALEVTKVLADWKEKHERVRILVDPQDALINSQVRAITKNVIKSLLKVEAASKHPRIRNKKIVVSDGKDSEKELLPQIN